MTELTLTPATADEAKPKTLLEQIRAHVIANIPANAIITDAGIARSIAHIAGFIASTPLSPLLDGEPIFVLRAQDKIGPYAVMAWATEAEGYGCPPDKVAGARQIVAEMCGWQMQHPTRVKRPD